MFDYGRVILYTPKWQTWVDRAWLFSGDFTTFFPKWSPTSFGELNSGGLARSIFRKSALDKVPHEPWNSHQSTWKSHGLCGFRDPEMPDEMGLFCYWYYCLSLAAPTGGWVCESVSLSFFFYHIQAESNKMEWPIHLRCVFPRDSPQSGCVSLSSTNAAARSTGLCFNLETPLSNSTISCSISKNIQVFGYWYPYFSRDTSVHVLNLTMSVGMLPIIPTK